MKVYVLVSVTYDYYEFLHNVTAGTDVRKIMKLCPDDKPLYTLDQHENCDGDTDHYYIEAFK